MAVLTEKASGLWRMLAGMANDGRPDAEIEDVLAQALSACTVEGRVEAARNERAACLADAVERAVDAARGEREACVRLLRVRADAFDAEAEVEGAAFFRDAADLIYRREEAIIEGQQP